MFRLFKLWFNPFTILALVLFPLLVQGGAIKINQPFADLGNVSFVVGFAPWNRVIYIADPLGDGVRHLYSVNTTGQGLKDLSGDLVAGGSVRGAKISPDLQRVVFMADKDNDEVFELYSVSVSGGKVIKISGNMAFGGDIIAATETGDGYYTISPNSQWVVFLADKDIDTVRELYLAPIAGGVVQKVNAPLELGERIPFNIGSEPTFTWDSHFLVYMAVLQTGAELFRYDIFTKKNIKLNSPLVPGGGIYSFEVSQNVEVPRVVYSGDQDVFDLEELFSVSIYGGEITKLNGPVKPKFKPTEIVSFHISPDGNRVVYMSEHLDDTDIEVYSTLIAGGELVRLSDGNNNSVGDMKNFVITPDGQRVIMLGPDTKETFTELFSARIQGGGSVKLNQPEDFQGNIGLPNISPNSERTLYRVTIGGGDQKRSRLYSVPTTGGGRVALTPDFVVGKNVVDYEITDDSKKVVIYGDLITQDQFELYSAPIEGGDLSKLSPALAANQDVAHPTQGMSKTVRIHPNSKSVVFTAGGPFLQSKIELYLAPIP
ncbi:MAG: hypothetical protein K1X66_08940 [Verrucomicrobiae bacterium]|nr:hypothetical protein [Verrucomicrobiae bacterium]